MVSTKKSVEEYIENLIRIFLLRRPPIEVDEGSVRCLRDEAASVTPQSYGVEFWNRKQSKLIRMIKRRNPAYFLNWNVILNTMFYWPEPVEYHYLNSSKDWPLLSALLVEDRLGDPEAYSLRKDSSGNLIHHMYTFVQFMEKTNFVLQGKSRIFEFGGGYGSFCRLLYRMGYQGNYGIFDFSAFACLQKFFLTNTVKDLDISYNIARYAEVGTNRRISLVSDIDSLRSKPKALENTDLFIGLWSLSESPIQIRDYFFDVLNDCKYILIGYQKEFAQIDNLEYFEGLMNRKKDYTWMNIKIPHIENDYYLMGQRNY